jgi:hypothetical protein
MNLQRNPEQVTPSRTVQTKTIQARLFAVGLFTASIGGTFAIFACVPLLARFTSSPPAPSQMQAFPAPDGSPVPQFKQLPEPVALPSKQARAIFSGNRPSSFKQRSAL